MGKFHFYSTNFIINIITNKGEIQLRIASTKTEKSSYNMEHENLKV